jgi:hypothetical protein
MVAVREARRLFRANHTTCFWWARPDLVVGAADVPWVADGLRKHGGRQQWRDAARLERLLAPQETPVTEQRGFVSATVQRDGASTIIDWSHESAWRFLPLVTLPTGGVVLHPIDLAINKLVALANRREPRDLVDVIFADLHVLPFPALVWAVVEKNPGLNPASYLELFRRRTLTPEDAAYLRFAGPYNVDEAARHFRRMVAEADAFIIENRHREPGALLQDRRTGRFFLPRTADDWDNVHEHRGALGGVIAQVADTQVADTPLLD